MRASVLMCIIISLLLSCKSELDGECGSPFGITVKESSIIDNKEVYMVDVNKNESWWINSIIVNGKELELDKGIATNKTFVLEKDLFILEKLNEKSLKLSLKDKSNENEIKVGVQSGNCFGGFTIN